MSERRKISVRKILQLLVTIIVSAGCVIAITSASKIENTKKINSVDVQIKNDKYHFVDKQQIMDMLITNRHLDMTHLTMDKLDIHSMEKIVSANPWIADAQVFVDNNHILHVLATQRVPVARVFEQNGNSYYIDATTYTMPLSTKYVYYTPVVTNVPELRDDSMSRILKSEIITMVRRIEADTFWNAQTSQIILDSDYSFELVPVLGNQKIVLGDTSRLNEKLDNLFLFYKNVLNKIGWDKYDVLDVRFKGQVVASPALPWKAPVDKAMSNMNWVKSIIDEEAKESTDDNPMIANKPNGLIQKTSQNKQIKNTQPKAVQPKVVAAIMKKDRKANTVSLKNNKSTSVKPKQLQTKTAATAVKRKLKVTAGAAHLSKKQIGKVKPQTKKKADKESDNKKAKPKYIYQGN
ncbi:MAG TPA: hypothetical protein VN721_01555 [Flavipsychrobacter sp.]|nr:hypothetical protein [Flavipsychrobacter sp.]